MFQPVKYCLESPPIGVKKASCITKGPADAAVRGGGGGGAKSSFECGTI